MAEEEFDYGTDQWDLIVLAYEPFPVTSKAYVDRLHRALKLGGLVVIESYCMDTNIENRSPIDIDPAKLKVAFKDFHLLHFEDKIDMPDWGKMPTRVVRMVAEKRF